MFNGEASSSSKNVIRSSSISGEMYNLEKGTSVSSDSAGGTTKKRRSSLGAKMVAIVGLSQWSKSTMQLNQPALSVRYIRRRADAGSAQDMSQTGIGKHGVSAVTYGRHTSVNTCGWSGIQSFIFPTTRLGAESQFSNFLDGLGPAQIVGRQTLATPPMGDVNIAMVDRNGQLEVEVIQARGLTPKPGSKTIPAPYIKLYLIESGACLSKKKTRTAKKTWDPVYQQVLQFDEGPQGKLLQVRFGNITLCSVKQHLIHSIMNTKYKKATTAEKYQTSNLLFHSTEP
ncbi:hypothetical protein GDO81_005884 [Engystomops pustulosus]|uniref:C2 domain-containing protein n=1 Tax=Engystomops pustulosus TaxID=76066 RepID=A0AAV7CUE2_ENGPU|nr:hypothetical protein GDO81_005884 [Engystomops pustulosus]